MLSLVLFGSMSASLEYASGRRTLTLAPRAAELLAFLALGRGEFFSRTDIADALWGDTVHEATVGCVNTALWRLRRSIEQPPVGRGDFLVTNRQGAAGLNGPGSVSLDVAEFERLTLPGLSKPLEQLTEGDCQGLRAGVAVYRDNVLGGFVSLWALRQRERLRNTFLNSAGRLMSIAGLRGEFDDAIHYARLVLSVDELREDVHRDLMRYLVGNGQRALALRQFEVCRTALLRELAIAPMPETMNVYRQIVDGLADVTHRTDSQPPIAAAKTPSPASPSHHVERARALLAEADQQLKQSLN